MTKVIEVTTSEVKDTPDAISALDAITHRHQRERFPVDRWVVLTWTQRSDFSDLPDDFKFEDVEALLTGEAQPAPGSMDHVEVHAIECLIEGDPEQAWVFEAVQSVTQSPVQQFIAVVNVAPVVTIAYSVECTGRMAEVALIFGQHAEAVQLNGPNLLAGLVESAKALWGQSWEPTFQPVEWAEGEE